MAEQIKKVVSIEIDVESGQIKQVDKEVDNINKGVKSVDKNLKKTQKGTKGLAGGFKKVGTALKGAGIGLLIAALATMMEVFKSNQGAVDAFSTGMTGLKIAFTDLFKFIENNIGPVIGYFEKLFEDPQKTIEELGKAIKEGLTKRFEQFMETLSIAGKALSEFFAGDFAAAWETAKEAAVEAVDVITGEDGGLEKIINTTKKAVGAINDYVSETLKTAGALTAAAKAAEFLEIKNRELQLSFQKLAEEQRQIRDDESVSIEKRIIANEELGAILKKAQDEEKAVVQKRIDFLNFENFVLGKRQERELALANLRVEKLDIEERIQGVQSEQLVNTNSLLREQVDLKKSIIDTDIALLDIESSTKVTLEKDEMEKLDIIEKSSLEKYTIQKAALDAEVELHKEGTAAFQDATNQRIILEAQRTADILLQQKTRHDLEIKQDAAAAQAKAEIQLQYLDTVGSVISIVEMFQGENKKVQKAAILADSAVGIAKTIISVNAASTAALATPQAIASSGVSAIPVIAATVAAGAASIAGIIKATDTAMKSLGGGGGGASPSLSGATSVAGGGAPQFNTVGQSGFNQVAGSIANQNQGPIKAYVVANDVTSQQSLDRNSHNKSSF
jgi:hypothetical protein